MDVSYDQAQKMLLEVADKAYRNINTRDLIPL